LNVGEQELLMLLLVFEMSYCRPIYWYDDKTIQGAAKIFHMCTLNVITQ